MNIRQMRQEIRQSLTPYTTEPEAAAMANIIMEDVKGYTPTEILLHGERELLPETIDRIRNIVKRIQDGAPMQYVLGSARFRGRDFIVAPGVLIPRPETAQLVDMIADQCRGMRDARVLDIGTGTGCIAISLALDLPYARVDAIDISDGALTIATDNAGKLKAKVSFIHADIHNADNTPIAAKTYDIIVSNPPYILPGEKAGMSPRVKDHEPAEALFADEADPTSIYKSIIRYAAEHLSQGGRIYLEINPLCADEIKRLLNHNGFNDAEILIDYKGNKRFATARR